MSHIPGSQHMLAWWIGLGVEPLDSGRGLVGLDLEPGAEE